MAGAPGSGESALFYAVMPGDNLAPIAAGAEVTFPHDGPSTSTHIVRVTPYDFQLTIAGTYRVSYQVPVIEPGQLAMSVQGVLLPYTTSGRDTGTSLIGLTTLIHVSAGEMMTLRASGTNSTSITISQGVGGATTVASLLIELVKAD